MREPTYTQAEVNQLLAAQREQMREIADLANTAIEAVGRLVNDSEEESK